MRSARLAAVVVSLSLLPAAAWADVRQVARRAGIAERTRTFSVAPVDFNRDRRDDIFLVRHNPDNPRSLPPSTLYRNEGRRYSNFITSGFANTDKHGCVWGRANADKRPDLFCAIGLTQFSVNELWIQNPDRSFTNRASDMGLTRDTHGRYRYATFIHANNDRRPDIYVARYTGDCFCGRYPGDNFPNELWINEGGSFRKAPEFGLNRPIGAKKDTSACAQAVDYNRDGHDDLLACGEKSVRLYRNNGGRSFTDVTARRGVDGNAFDAGLVHLNKDKRRDLVMLTRSRLTISFGTRRGWRDVDFAMDAEGGEALAFGRFNPGPLRDIYVLRSRGGDRNDNSDAILINRGRGRFRTNSIPATSGSGDDVASLDYDGDGRTDFVVTNGDRKKPGPVQLFTWVRRARR
jgi:hypothetical protein